ncbi:MAG: hypothetical protein NTW28_29500 [Candidatus Solibacter sp.]|nr:hypothetical protein [Candidatus Solibacter sp.]
MQRNARAVVLAALISASCHPVIETPENHIVHKGETAMVVQAGRSTAVVAISKNAAHQLSPALNVKDQIAVDRLISEGKAFELANRTIVKVERESFNEREVRVLDGPFKGRTGWVPFESLKPYVEKR